MTHRRFTISEKLNILNEADQLGVIHVQSKYNITSDIISRWDKDLKKSKARQSTIKIKKQEDSLVIESLKAQIKQLKKVISNQTPLLQNTDQKPKVNEPITNSKEDELYRLVASLIVQHLLNDVDEEPSQNQMLGEE